MFTSGCFYVFIPAAPLLVLIATDEDYCIVVETPGFHILSSTVVLLQKGSKYDYSEPHRPLQDNHYSQNIFLHNSFTAQLASYFACDSLFFDTSRSLEL